MFIVSFMFIYCCPRYLEGHKVSGAKKTEMCIYVYVCGIYAHFGLFPKDTGGASQERLCEAPAKLL